MWDGILLLLCCDEGGIPVRGMATMKCVLRTRVLMEESMFTKQLVSGTKYLGVMTTSFLALLAASLNTV